MVKLLLQMPPQLPMLRKMAHRGKGLPQATWIKSKLREVSPKTRVKMEVETITIRTPKKEASMVNHQEFQTTHITNGWNAMVIVAHVSRQIAKIGPVKTQTLNVPSVRIPTKRHSKAMSKKHAPRTETSWETKRTQKTPWHLFKTARRQKIDKEKSHRSALSSPWLTHSTSWKGQLHRLHPPQSGI